MPVSRREPQHCVRKNNHKAKQICLNSFIGEPDPKDKRQINKDFEDKFQFFVNQIPKTKDKEIRISSMSFNSLWCSQWQSWVGAAPVIPIQTLLFSLARFFCFCLFSKCWSPDFENKFCYKLSSLFV